MLRTVRKLPLNVISCRASSQMADGPDLRDFIVGEVKEKTWTEYQGKLKRDVGDKRLRLPPWLKGNLDVKTARFHLPQMNALLQVAIRL